MAFDTKDHHAGLMTFGVAVRLYAFMARTKAAPPPPFNRRRHSAGTHRAR
jgi:hypothetical protein